VTAMELVVILQVVVVIVHRFIFLFKNFNYFLLKGRYGSRCQFGLSFCIFSKKKIFFNFLRMPSRPIWFTLFSNLFMSKWS